tara:strand:+ start:4517 stop:5683 length:1167 start_codon:yes stop_codon:yes gene_type:complete
MNILFCGSLDCSSQKAAMTTISFFKKALIEKGHQVYIMGAGESINSRNLIYDETTSLYLYQRKKLKRYLPKSFQIIHNDKESIEENLPYLIEKKSINMIIVYSTFFPVLEKVVTIGKKYNIHCLTYGGEFFSVTVANILSSVNIYQILAKKFSYDKYQGHICSTAYHEKTLKNNLVKTIVLPTVAPGNYIGSSYIANKNDATFKLVFMGKITEREQISKIIKGVRMARNMDLNIKLYLISSIENKKGFLINKIKRESLTSPYIYITGFLSEKQKYSLLKKANAFIHLRKPSKETAHAFPTRVPEYADYSKPIIFSNCPPFSDYFIHAKNAYFISPKNEPRDIAKAIINLHKDRELSSRIGINCRILAKSKFSLEIIGNKLVDFIESYQ